MTTKKDSPGVYLPPPLIYVLTFIAAILIQKKIKVDDQFFHLQVAKITGMAFLIFALVFLIKSLTQFFRTKNTLILIKPASSLQTNGIYKLTRNPMYAGLALVYLGISCFIGNWWNILLFPLLLLIVQNFVILKEEKYLERRFGQDYLDYKAAVRRWL